MEVAGRVTVRVNVLKGRKDEVHQPSPPEPVKGKLVPVGEVADGYHGYELLVDRQPVDLSTANIRSTVVSYEGGKTTPLLPRPAGTDSANPLWFASDSAPGKYIFRFVDVQKRVYEAEIHWKGNR